MSKKIKVIGDEIHYNGSLVAVIHPSALFGDRDDFIRALSVPPSNEESDYEEGFRMGYDEGYEKAQQEFEDASTGRSECEF